MFGQNNDDQSQQQPAGPADQNPVLTNSEPPSGFFSPAATQNSPIPGQDITPPGIQTDHQDNPVLTDSNPTAFGAPAPVIAADDAPVNPTTAPLPQSINSDDLLNMKQQALQHLTPLVNHLDQSPEEKFRTVMMMIQAADDHTKLNEAFEAAKNIPEDKARAQALLDVINEINYFTQNSQH